MSAGNTVTTGPASSTGRQPSALNKLSGGEHGSRLVGAGFILAVLALWEALSRSGAIDIRFYSTPSRVLGTAWEAVLVPELRAAVASQVWSTLSHIAIGLVLGVLAGILLGLAMAIVPPVRWAVSPVIYGSYTMPKLALLPLALIIFGINSFSIIALAALGVAYIMALSTLDGVLYQDPIYKDVADAFAIPAHVRYRLVVLPGAIANLSTGVKLSIAQAFVTVVSVELVVGESGLGYLIWSSWQVFDIDTMFVGMALIAALGLLASWAGSTLERSVTKWAPQNRKSR